MFLVDINIFEDVIRRRKDWEGSLCILSEVRKGKIKGFISALTIPIIYFLRPKSLTEKERREKVKEVKDGFEIIDLSAQIIEDSITDIKLFDFEDAIQYYSAKDKKIPIIITRNKKHFEIKSDVQIKTPEEFLSK